MMPRPDNIIWDWNGTLLDDAWTGLEAKNAVLASRGLPLIQDADAYRDVFTFPVEDYYEKVGLDRALFPIVSHEWMAEYKQRENICMLREGAVETLNRLRSAGIRQVLASASEAGNLKAQMDRFPLKGFFDAVLALDHIYATGKKGIARKWMDGANIRPGSVVLVGDTLHDWEVACDIGCRCVLLEGGHQSRRVLLSAGCPVIGSLSQLVALLDT